MSGTIDPLVRDLVAFCAKEPRPLREILENWRTSCPRLTIWEDAVDLGLLERVSGPEGPEIRVTARGLSSLSTPSSA